MTESLEALIALSKSGTMALAASRLRVTPSAISKRIALLEEETGYAVIEKSGRLVRLTPAGRKLIERVEPLLTDLRLALADKPGETGGEISIGVSESILASWGARLLVAALRRRPGLKLNLGSHRSPLVVERVLSGEYALGLCAGVSSRSSDLHIQELGREPMVIVPAGLKSFRFSPQKAFEILTIEPHASTWESLKPQLKKFSSDRGIDLRVVDTVQSFSGAVQLAKAGYAHALVPQGIARAMGVVDSKQILLPGITRPISWIARPSTLGRDLIRGFLSEIEYDPRA